MCMNYRASNSGKQDVAMNHIEKDEGDNRRHTWSTGGFQAMQGHQRPYTKQEEHHRKV